MRILSIQVAEPQKIQWKGQEFLTSIFKKPISTPSIRVLKNHLEGDGQGDTEVHGGQYKAVYAYSRIALQEWAKRLGHEAPDGLMGENLTLDDCDESQVGVGDTFRMGTALLRAAQPRRPCVKLNIRTNSDHAIKTFFEINRPGVYFEVVQEGTISLGDTWERLDRPPAFFSISELSQCLHVKRMTAEQFARIQFLPGLDPRLLERLKGITH